MFWNKKDEKKSLPDLPPLKSPFSQDLTPNSSISNQPDNLEDLTNDMEKHSLPSFPDSPMNKGFSQSAIKEAVTEDGMDVEGEEEAIPQKLQGQKTFKNEDYKEEVIESKDSIEEENPYLTSIKSKPIKKDTTQASIPELPAEAEGIEPMQTVPPVKQTPANSFPILPNNPYLKTPVEPPAPLQIPKAIVNAGQRTIRIPQPIRPMTSQMNDKEGQVPPSILIDDTNLNSSNVQSQQKPQIQRQSSPINLAPIPITTLPQPKKDADIFVKIDKFFTAKKALLSITQDVEDIDSLLKKIRDVKVKEEKELFNWEKQITSIKERIQTINSSIFEKTS